MRKKCGVSIVVTTVDRRRGFIIAQNKFGGSGTKTICYIYVVLAFLVWGTAGLFVAGLTACGFDSLQNAMARCAASAIFLLAVMLIKYKELVRVTWKQLIPIAVEGSTFYGMAATFFYAITYTPAPTASMLLSVAPSPPAIFNSCLSRAVFLESGEAELAEVGDVAIAQGVHGLLIGLVGVINTNGQKNVGLRALT